MLTRIVCSMFCAPSAILLCVVGLSRVVQSSTDESGRDDSGRPAAGVVDTTSVTARTFSSSPAGVFRVPYVESATRDDADVLPTSTRLLDATGVR